MKVLIVLDSLKRAGAERQALLAVGEMTRQGRDVELIYYNKATAEYDIQLAAPAVVRRLPKNGEKLRFLWKLARHLRRGGYDVVHAFMSATSIYVGLAGWLAGVPVRFGGMRSEYDGVGIIRLCHRIVNRLLTGWICNSEATRQSMLSGVGATADRVFVVHNGIDPLSYQTTLRQAEAKAKLGIAADQPVVTLMGRLTYQKNIPLFLEAAAIVSRRRDGARFLIIGEGELDSVLRKQIDDLGLARSVRLLGIRSDVPDLLRATDVMTLTSRYEGVSNTLLEAMAVGTPVVSTAYAGVEELVTDGSDGFVVPLGDAHALAEKYMLLIDDPSLRRRMGAVGMEKIRQRFTIRALGANLYDVYDRTYRMTRGNGTAA